MKNLSRDENYALSRASTLRQNRDFGRAEDLYCQILAQKPDFGQAHHELGILKFQTGAPQVGLYLVRRAVQITPESLDFQVSYVEGLIALGRVVSAKAAIDGILANGAKAARLEQLAGWISSELNRRYGGLFDFDSLLQVALQIHQNGALQQAKVLYEAALELNPNSGVTLHFMGVLALQEGRYEDACDLLRKAADIVPGEAAIHSNLATALVSMNRMDEAVLAFTRAIILAPDFMDALYNFGNFQRHQARWDQARAFYRRSLAISALSPQANSNLANTYLACGELGLAAKYLCRALCLAPDGAEHLNNWGILLHDLWRLSDSLTWFTRAVRIDIHHADARYNRALGLLAKGDFLQGWSDHEYRNLRTVNSSNSLGPKTVELTQLSGKSVLLLAEQGLGDTLQFARYAQLMTHYADRVILQVQPPLRQLFKSWHPDIHVISDGEHIPSYDFQFHLMSMPFVFRTEVGSIPNAVPYLAPDQTRVAFWKKRVEMEGRFKVGLVWSGGLRADRPDLLAVNNRRNIPLSLLAPLKQCDAVFYSLQKGTEAEADLHNLVRQGWDGPEIINFMDEIFDFSDTAALMENLDLIISVDTSSVHLAGAMGKPVWILNRFDTCWRWMAEGTDTPWYPSARLFRQHEMGNWVSVVEDVVDALKRLNTKKRDSDE